MALRSCLLAGLLLSRDSTYVNRCALSNRFEILPDKQNPAHWRGLFFGSNVRIWTPPRFTSNPLDGSKVRLHTYIRPLKLACVDAGP